MARTASPTWISAPNRAPAEVGGGKQPSSWFTGFLREQDFPYAFAVVVEEGGSGAGAAGNVAAQVLDALVNGY